MGSMPTYRHALIAVAVSALALAGCHNGPPAAQRAADAPSTDVAVAADVESPSPDPTPSDVALTTHLDDVQAGPADTFVLHSSRADVKGGKVARYTRKYHGLPVVGGDIAVHTDAAGGYLGMSNGLAAPLRVETVPRLSSRDALAKARARFAGKIDKVQPPRLVVDASTGTGRLAWESVVIGVGPDGQTPSRLHVFTDARTGDVLTSWDAVESEVATGNGHFNGRVEFDTRRAGTSFVLVDDARGGNAVCDDKHTMNDPGPACPDMTDGNNLWGTGSLVDPQTTAVDVAYGLARTYDFYNQVFGRKGVFDTGKGMQSIVHFGDQYPNAAFIGDGINVMIYGDGPNNVNPFAELDVTAHENTHGVTEHSVPGGLVYAGESGGLNEATSDIMGMMVKFWAANPGDPARYIAGEKMLPVFQRSMVDPAQDGESLGCWSAQAKDVDVHFSSGIGNHFYFDLAEGTGRTKYGTSPVCGSAPGVTGIGREKAQQIWYRALTVYFTSNTDYHKARGYTLSAAADLYGRCGTEYQAVQAAWTAVAVTGQDPACR